jgi:hypothetical protein
MRPLPPMTTIFISVLLLQMFDRSDRDRVKEECPALAPKTLSAA